VQQLIIPRRARLAPDGDARQATTAMLAEWDAIKELGIRR